MAERCLIDDNTNKSKFPRGSGRSAWNATSIKPMFVCCALFITFYTTATLKRCGLFVWLSLGMNDSNATAADFTPASTAPIVRIKRSNERQP